MALQWILRPQDHEQVRQLCEATGLSPVVAQILAMRGVTRPAEVEAFFDLRMTRLYPPAGLPGMADAVAILRAAIAEGQKILVYGDYDCDGMTAAAILFRALKLLGADVSTFIPSRVDDGYGLNADQIRRHAARGIKLLVSVDCGVASVDEVRLANELGLTVVVTDHHQVGFHPRPRLFIPACRVAAIRFRISAGPGSRSSWRGRCSRPRPAVSDCPSR
jgi:single-stranded-DNA-specific exonuclease